MSLEKFHKNITTFFKNKGIDAEFTIDKHINKPKIVFSACIFKLDDPYRDETLYIKGLNNTIEELSKNFKDSSVRLYYDDSILMKNSKWDIEKLKKYENTELIKYNFKQFKVNSTFHKDLFGTMMRLLPLFNFDINEEIVVIIDIDSTEEDMRKQYISQFKKFIKSAKKEGKIIFSTYKSNTFIDNERLEFINITKNYHFTPRAIMHSIVCSKKIDKNILLDFLHCMLTSCNTYKEWARIVYKRVQGKKTKMSDVIKNAILKNEDKGGIFMYGIDEFFINEYIVKYHLENKIPFTIHYQFPNMNKYHYILFNLYNKKMLSYNFIDEMYKIILQDKYIEKNINENFKTLDKIIYKKTHKFYEDDINKSKESIILHRRIYNFLKKRVNDLFNNMINLSDIDKLNYKLYFSLIENINFDVFIDKKKLYKITYKSELKYNFIVDE